MALITCPECGKQISDRAEICIGCGFPIQKHIKEESINTVEELSKRKKLPEKGSMCEKCGYTIDRLVGKCPNCKDGGRMMPITLLENIQTNNETREARKELESFKIDNFNGIYTYDLHKNKILIYCPRCESSNCEWQKKQIVKAGKTKTQIKRNVNPLKPLTKYNVKETTIIPETNRTEKIIVCKDCGMTFRNVDAIAAYRRINAKNP